MNLTDKIEMTLVGLRKLRDQYQQYLSNPPPGSEYHMNLAMYERYVGEIQSLEWVLCEISFGEE